MSDSEAITWIKREDKSDYKKEEIEWQVLDYDDENNRLMLLSKYLVEEGEYNKKNKKVTWEKSTLREWLNGYFYYDAFSAPERALIRLTDVKNKKNPVYGTNCGKNTKDHVFLLSMDEMEKYFNEDLSSEEITYLPGLKCRYYNGNVGSWWLRSIGIGYDEEDYCAAFVREYLGLWYVDSEGMYVIDPSTGIRPAVWIKI